VVILQRDALRDLGAWFSGRRRKPLVIRGARQVGKSTLVRAFAKSYDLDLVEINLEQNLFLEEVFASLDASRIFSEIEALVRRQLSKQSLLFLDEIQSTPSGLTALRYIAEYAPDLPIIAAGSLLEFVLRDHQFSMPVGRIEYLHLGPMRFSEFLDALGEDWGAGKIRSWKIGEAFPDSIHRYMLKLLRQYFAIGGMPEAVEAFAFDRSLQRVSKIHRSIISTYKDDFNKYAVRQRDLLNLQRLFAYVPGTIGKKMKYSAVSRDESARNLHHSLELLFLSRVILPVFHSDATGIPLGAEINHKVYKCLFLDIGLMNSILGLSEPYLATLEAVKLVNEGGLAEQFVGQHLAYQESSNIEPGVFYWLREGRTNNAEIDYVISYNSGLIPIEVKAGKSGSLRSLHQFILARSPEITVRFDANPPSFNQWEHSAGPNMKGLSKIEYKLLSLPMYMVGEMPRLIADLHGQ